MPEPTVVAQQDFASLPILLVDDNEDDAYFFQRAWKAAGIPNPLTIVSDGARFGTGVISPLFYATPCVLFRSTAHLRLRFLLPDSFAVAGVSPP